MSSILYYSNFCQHSKALVGAVGRTPEITKDVHFLCIDKRTKRGDKTYLILENGQEIVMPNAVSMVPALLLLNDNHRIIYGEEIMKFFRPRQQVVTRVATQNNMEPQAFSLSGGDYGSISDSFSFFDMTPEDLSAKGTGGTMQMHNFVPLDHVDLISKPPRDDVEYKAPKMSEDVTIEKLMQQREQDFQSINTGNQKY